MGESAGPGLEGFFKDRPLHEELAERRKLLHSSREDIKTLRDLIDTTYKAIESHKDFTEVKKRGLITQVDNFRELLEEDNITLEKTQEIYDNLYILIHGELPN